MQSNYNIQNYNDVQMMLCNFYQINKDELVLTHKQLSDGDDDSDNYFDNLTLSDYVKKSMSKYHVKNEIFTKINVPGLYIFEITITTTLYPDLPICYSFCYVNDGKNKPYVIVNYCTDTKLFYLNTDINELLTNITERKLAELFRPNIHEQYLFDNLIKVNSITYDYYSVI